MLLFCSQQNVMNFKQPYHHFQFCSRSFRLCLAAACATKLDIIDRLFFAKFNFIDKAKIMNNNDYDATQNRQMYVSGCKLCNTLNDGICANFCLLNAQERKIVIANNFKLFHKANVLTVMNNKTENGN
jgi:hypothetical protein